MGTTQLYRLPWTSHNNPNGWVEPTTHCQLKCPQCYRYTDRPGFRPAHRPIEEMEAEVDELIRRRNLQSLTISGGEPLLYPDLERLIGHARGKGLQVMVLTNGVALDRSRVEWLRDRGVARVMVHVERIQARPGCETEEDANRLRDEHCRTFRSVGGITLGFLMTVSRESLADLDVAVPSFRGNADVVRSVIFSNRQEPVKAGEAETAERADDRAVSERVKELFGLEYCACLGKTRSSGCGWLFGVGLYAGGELIGSMDADAFRFIQERAWKRLGRYPWVGGAVRFSPGLAWFALRNRSLRPVLRRAALGRAIHHQVVAVINTPRRTPAGWDFCDGCPDAMLHEGRLVPSCLLEMAKAGEDVAL